MLGPRCGLAISQSAARARLIKRPVSAGGFARLNLN